MSFLASEGIEQSETELDIWWWGSDQDNYEKYNPFWEDGGLVQQEAIKNNENL